MNPTGADSWIDVEGNISAFVLQALCTVHYNLPLDFYSTPTPTLENDQATDLGIKALLHNY